MEQLIETLPGPVKVYVREHKPKNSREAGVLADDYVQARGSADGGEKKTTSEGGKKRCHRCGKPGHLNEHVQDK